VEEYNEEELLYLVHCGSEEAIRVLLEKYYLRISRWVMPYCHYSHLGFDREDFIQIGIIHFYTLLNSYRSDLGSNLYTYMKIGIIRQIVKTVSVISNEAVHQKNYLISFDEYISDNEEGFFYKDIIPDQDERYQPQERFMIKERTIEYKKKFNEQASLQEKEVVLYLLKGYNAQEISKTLDISLKSVYNAIYRCHRKCKPLTEKNKYVKL